MADVTALFNFAAFKDMHAHDPQTALEYSAAKIAARRITMLDTGELTEFLADHLRRYQEPNRGLALGMLGSFIVYSAPAFKYLYAHDPKTALETAASVAGKEKEAKDGKRSTVTFSALPEIAKFIAEQAITQPNLIPEMAQTCAAFAEAGHGSYAFAALFQGNLETAIGICSAAGASGHMFDGIAALAETVAEKALPREGRHVAAAQALCAVGERSADLLDKPMIREFFIKAIRKCDDGLAYRVSAIFNDLKKAKEAPCIQAEAAPAPAPALAIAG